MECGQRDMLANYYAVLNINYHASTQQVPEAFYNLVNDPRTDEAHIDVVR